VKRNLKSMGMGWEETGELAADRTEWRQHVAQCIYDAGWTEQNRTVSYFISAPCITRTQRVFHIVVWRLYWGAFSYAI